MLVFLLEHSFFCFTWTQCPKILASWEVSYRRTTIIWLEECNLFWLHNSFLTRQMKLHLAKWGEQHLIFRAKKSYKSSGMTAVTTKHWDIFGRIWLFLLSGLCFGAVFWLLRSLLLHRIFIWVVCIINTSKMNKIIKGNKDLISYFVYNNFKNALSSSQYPNGLKYADVTPVFKKDDKSDKSNYRPISILPNLSKVYERIMQNQIYPYLNKIFSKYQCGFRKGFSAQHCLIAMIEKWRQSLDSGGQAAAVLTDLSKAFDCIDHELLIAKLNAYGFNNSFIHSFIQSLFILGILT